MKTSIKGASAFAITTLALLMLPISSSRGQSSDNSGSAGTPEYSAAPDAANPQLIDDATLHRTANAFAKVTQITQTEKQAVDGAPDDTAKMKAKQQAESDKVTAVKAEGLQPKQYNQVLQLVQTDSNLQQKFLSYVNRGSAQPGM